MDFLRLLSEYRTLWLTSLFSTFTYLGEEVISITIICFLYWCYNKNLARRVALVYFISGLLVQSLKITFCIPRPWIIDPTFKPVSALQSSATGYSFPSGHTQGSTAIYGSLAYLTNKLWKRIVFVLLFMGVGFSRMYLGYHTPKDVLTSLCVTLLIIYLINHIFDITKLHQSKVALFLFLYSSLNLVYTLILKNQPNADFSQFHDCFKALGAGLGFALGWYIEPLYIQFKEQTLTTYLQVIKLVLGLIIALALKSVLKNLLGTTLIADTIRYFILVSFIMILYPILIKKYFNIDSKKN